MSKHRSETTEPDNTKPAASAAEQAHLEKGGDGQPDPAAQAKISAAAGQRGRGDLATELGALPNVAALDGVRANAAAGYYKTRPADELVADLQGVQLESEEHQKIRDALVERAKGGAFSA